MIGTLLGIVVGIGMCIEAWNGQLQAWTIGAVVVIVLIGLLIPMTVGTFLMGITIASPVAAILGFVTGNAASGVNAIIIGLLAFVGQFILGAFTRQRLSQ